MQIPQLLLISVACTHSRLDDCKVESGVGGGKTLSFGATMMLIGTHTLARDTLVGL